MAGYRVFLCLSRERTADGAVAGSKGEVISLELFHRDGAVAGRADTCIALPFGDRDFGVGSNQCLLLAFHVGKRDGAIAGAHLEGLGYCVQDTD